MSKAITPILFVSSFITAAIVLNVMAVKQLLSGLYPDVTIKQAISLTFLFYVARGMSYGDHTAFKKATVKDLLEVYAIAFFGIPSIYAGISMILFAIF